MPPRASTTLAELYDEQYRRTVILLLVFFILAVLFLLTQQLVLRKVKRENRSMPPGLVWLQLIPLLGQIWQYIVVVRIGSSLRKEMAARQADPLFGADARMVENRNSRPTMAMGLTYCILMNCAILLTVLVDLLIVMHEMTGIRQAILGLDGLAMIASMFSWVTYWVMLAVWARRLRQRVVLGTA